MLSRRRFLAGLAAMAAGPAWPDDPATWARLRAGGLVLMIRHASTEAGLGDPPHFRLGDCATQRNLSDQGRAESRRLGERLRSEKVPIAKVYTSPWCRCRETAVLAFGHAEDWEPLGSFFDAPDREAEATQRVRKRIAGYAARAQKGNVVMVTHSVNIAAIARVSPATAEVVIVRPDGCCNVRSVERLRL